MKQKIETVFGFIIIAIIVITVMVFTYLFLKNQNEIAQIQIPVPTPIQKEIEQNRENLADVQPTNISDKPIFTDKLITDKKNWKIYKDNQIMFKYPDGLSVEYVQDSNVNDERIQVRDYENMLNYDIEIHHRLSGDKTCCADKYLGNKPSDKLFIDGSEAYKYLSIKKCDKNNCSDNFDAITFEHGSDTWYAMTTNSLSDKTFQNILSTFKFTK